MKYLSKNVNIKLDGEGNAMILLHGWGQSIEMMAPLHEHFKTKYQVMSYDFPGFGESEESELRWTLEDYVTMLHQLVKAYKLKNITIIAHSFGARVALLYAKLYPVNHLILTGAAGIRSKRSLSYYYKVYSYKLKRRLFPKTQGGSVDYQNASSIMRGILVNVVNRDLKNELKHIKVNTLLVFGELDQETPLWMAKKMEKELPHATLIILEGDDHFAYYHQMQRFIKICECYLEGSEADVVS